MKVTLSSITLTVRIQASYEINYNARSRCTGIYRNVGYLQGLEILVPVHGILRFRSNRIHVETIK